MTARALARPVRRPPARPLSRARAPRETLHLDFTRNYYALQPAPEA